MTTVPEGMQNSKFARALVKELAKSKYVEGRQKLPRTDPEDPWSARKSAFQGPAQDSQKRFQASSQEERKIKYI